ncbi:GNAT family N-acetyltransferase [Flavobacteriaceae bacterium D16]|nr:GNAT family N-acetyltransferase [Flavobacteriaceae bacterium D16]
MEIKVLQEKDITPEIEQQISLLMDQLNPLLRPQQLVDVISESTSLYVLCALEGKEIMGIASLALYSVLSGRKGWVEDVVVDQKHRRKGIAKLLTEELIRLSKELELDQLLLYTGTHRKEAHRLYESCGFSLKNSHLYHMAL